MAIIKWKIIMQTVDWPSCQCKLLFGSALIITTLAALAATSPRPPAKHQFSILNELFISLPVKSLHWLNISQIINLCSQTVSRCRYISQFHFLAPYFMIISIIIFCWTCGPNIFSFYFIAEPSSVFPSGEAGMAAGRSCAPRHTCESAADRPSARVALCSSVLCLTSCDSMTLRIVQNMNSATKNCFHWGGVFFSDVEKTASWDHSSVMETLVSFASHEVSGHMISSLQLKVQHYTWTKGKIKYILIFLKNRFIYFIFICIHIYIFCSKYFRNFRHILLLFSHKLWR